MVLEIVNGSPATFFAELMVHHFAYYHFIFFPTGQLFLSFDPLDVTGDTR